MNAISDLQKQREILELLYNLNLQSSTELDLKTIKQEICNLDRSISTLLLKDIAERQ